LATQAKVGFVSLGCPKATVDSEHIVTELQKSGYEVVASGDSEGSGDSSADVVVVNTCGFIDAAREESFGTIDDLLEAGKKVVVTGCLGHEQTKLKERFPELEFVSGPAVVDPVIQAVKHYEPIQKTVANSVADARNLSAEPRTRLTPEHYAYLKISEGCNHKCSFCIIPSMRGQLRSRALQDIVEEAHVAVAQGAKELLLIAQDLSAYGLDLKYKSAGSNGEILETNLYQLSQALRDVAPWIRLHYVYPYPNVDRLIPLMNEGFLLPYLDMPLQHAEPRILKSMRRPAAAEKTLERIERWRAICPDLAIRSTFIVGFPGETEDDVGTLLDFLEAAQLDRVGCFTYSAVDGAHANLLDSHLDESEKLDRQERVYEIQAAISQDRLSRHVGKRMRVLVDTIDESTGTAVARSQYDAPEIDGNVFITNDKANGGIITPGEFVWAEILEADDHDLWGVLSGQEVQIR
jgi:ribosomal protein S12 methylthiotransferase